MPPVTRRSFFSATSAAALAPILAPPAMPSTTAAMLRRVDGGLSGAFPAQDAEVVRTVVGKAHVDYETVHDLVTSRRELAKATWDWGFGDWESALGAASHMGRRDIAEVLIAHGARPNLFTFAMLGQVDVIRSICEANPGIQRLPGPHGITLLQHARAGKEQASDVVDYLESLGDADTGQTTLPTTKADAAALLGEYEPAGAPEVVFRIGYNERRSVVSFQRDDRQLRFILRVGEDAFAPGGAPSVRITFQRQGDRVSGLTITDGPLRISARRVRDQAAG
jgi:hypothetical protein